MANLLLYVRQGFEAEAAAEISSLAATHSMVGYTKARPNTGFITFELNEPSLMLEYAERLSAQDLCFARQVVWSSDLVRDLPENDRITPLMETIRQLCTTSSKTGRFSEVRVETADTNEAKELLPFCKSFQRPLEAALKRAGLLDSGKATNAPGPVLHVFFLGYSAAYVGFSFPHMSSPWFMGIPRLKFPREAPSRSTLKLEEAFLVLLSEAERQALLVPGMHAVDLGAAPGGWTYQLIKRNIHVSAVDNGAMAPELLETGIVHHFTEDGFRFQPKKPVDWLVCDMVEQPSRIAQLVARWLHNGWCRQSIFNLKLPMKKRYQEVVSCIERLKAEGLPTPNSVLDVRVKQLYHDREEVTCFVRLVPRRERQNFGGR